MKHWKIFLVNQWVFSEGSALQHNRLALSLKRKTCDEKSKSFTTAFSELPKAFDYLPLKFERAFVTQVFQKDF